MCVCVSNICTCINAKLHVLFKGARESPTQDNYLLCRNVINTNSSHYKSPSAMLRRAGCRPSSSRPLPLQHFPTRRENRKRGRCRNCQKNKRRTDTTWFCTACNEWLCHIGNPTSDCYLLWHKRLDYSTEN